MASPLLFVLAILLLVGLGVWWSLAQAKKRRELMSGFARSNGWTWAPEGEPWRQFTGTPFDDGDHRKALNVLSGPFRNRAMTAFDYSYQTHSTDSQGNSTTQTHHFAVCALALPAFVPALELTPEGVLGRVGTMLGMQDIELESEDFNRRFRVRCADPKFAYDVLPARTMEALLARPAQHLRLSDGDALCWEKGTHSPTELLARLDTLSKVLDGIPGFVWTDLKGSAS